MKLRPGFRAARLQTSAAWRIAEELTPSSSQSDPWSSFDKRMGWLQYGFYALVETQANRFVTRDVSDNTADAPPIIGYQERILRGLDCRR